MFLAETRTLLQEAFKQTFDADYPAAHYRQLGARSSLEGPVRTADLPMVWVDFQPATELVPAGIGYVEWSEPAEDGSRRRFTRWRFTGFATYTFIALSSVERDQMVDEFVKVVAFGLENPATATFRRYIEQNDLIGLTLNWHRVSLQGRSDAQGTPWGTDEWVYEQTVQLEVANGEFVSDGSTRGFIPLSQVALYPWAEGQEPDPAPDFTTDESVEPPTSPDGWI